MFVIIRLFQKTPEMSTLMERLLRRAELNRVEPDDHDFPTVYSLYQWNYYNIKDCEQRAWVFTSRYPGYSQARRLYLVSSLVGELKALLPMYKPKEHWSENNLRICKNKLLELKQKTIELLDFWDEMWAEQERMEQNRDSSDEDSSDDNSEE